MVRMWRALGTVALAITLASPGAAQTRADCERAYTPQRAQEGKDVVWEPTQDAMVVRMLEMAKVTSADLVYDLGSGDGKIPIAAAKHFGATAVGIEYEPDLVTLSRCLAAAEGLQRRVTFEQADLFATDFSRASVVTLYLLPALNLRLRPTLLAMKPGTRVVSYSFTMGEWEPDDHIDSLGDGSAYLWLVPANVAGTWTFRSTSDSAAFDVAFEQVFQNLTGRAGGAAVTGKLQGERIEFAFAADGHEVRVTGTVQSQRISATAVRAGVSTQYVGTRN